MAGRGKAISQGDFEGLEELSTEQKKAQIWDSFRDSIKPPERLDLDEWADRNYILPRQTSSEHGQWKTSRFPFLRRPMKALSPSSRAKEISVIKGAQLGYTEILKAKICYNAEHNPVPTMYVQKTKDAAEDFSTQKLDPTIEAMPILDEVLGTKKPKNLSNSWNNKGFPGGFVVMGGANSGAFLRSKSISDALVDEEDSFKANIDGEGSPVSMIRKRQANFPMSKMGRISTPKIKETSTIEPAYLAGSQERYYVPCPCCNPHNLPTGTYFVIGWTKGKGEGSYITWDKDKNKEAILDDEGIPTGICLVCETCDGKIPEHKKTWMLDRGKWMSQKDSPDRPYEVGDVEYPSFQISSLYSPLGFFSWKDAVKEWFEYKNSGDKALLQVFVNQTLGESYTSAGQDISSNWLYERREEYLSPVPLGGLVLTAGVDVQADRLEVEVTAWGLREESYSVAYKVFQGDTGSLGDENGMDGFGRPTSWTLLDDFLMETFEHESGVKMPIECTLVDSKYRSAKVHEFCKLREHRRIFPHYGMEGWGKGNIERPKRRSEKHGTYHFKIFVDEIKSTIYSLLANPVPGPGYQHFPIKDEFSEKYFNGLTAENKKVKQVNGTAVQYWECPAHVRNEPLDCRVYSYAAFKVYDPNLQYRSEQETPIPRSAKDEEGIEEYTPPPKTVQRKAGGKKGTRPRKKSSAAQLF